jgi:hypothetical protein
MVEIEQREQKAASLEAELQLKNKCEEMESKCQQLSDELLSVEEALLDDMARLNSEVNYLISLPIYFFRTKFSSLNYKIFTVYMVKSA